MGAGGDGEDREAGEETRTSERECRAARSRAPSAAWKRISGGNASPGSASTARTRPFAAWSPCSAAAGLGSWDEGRVEAVEREAVPCRAVFGAVSQL